MRKKLLRSHIKFIQPPYRAKLHVLKFIIALNGDLYSNRNIAAIMITNMILMTILLLLRKHIINALSYCRASEYCTICASGGCRYLLSALKQILGSARLAWSL